MQFAINDFCNSTTLLSKATTEIGVKRSVLEGTIRYVQYFWRMALAVVSLSRSPAGAHSCADKIHIQSAEL